MTLRSNTYTLITAVFLLSLTRCGLGSREDITFTDKSWKTYVSKDHDPAWKNGTDELSDQG
jgi:major membrane immunogen (membrane-anchored lipoprotein)